MISDRKAGENDLETIYEALKKYADSDAYPFHMPGHKRKIGWILDPFHIDITEIDGFDNLHCAEGMILEAQKKAARLYQAEESFYLVNGSTAGILSAISACVKKNGKILMARNSHKSAYHAVSLRNLDVVYLYPEVILKYGMNGGYDAEEIRRILEEDDKIEAVFLTSPTYDGVVSDIKKIAKIVHSFQIPLIVDEAHGAHFGIAEGFPQSAVKNGADLVIQSLHKTLPSLTQTAILHRNGNIADRDRLMKYLQIYQTSSPSYIFMAAMDECVTQMIENGEKLFQNFRKKLTNFRKDTKDLKLIHIPSEELKGKNGVFDFDPSKLILSVRECEKSGKWLMEKLRQEFHLELEMASGDYALAMTSICDEDEGFERLSDALHHIDRKLCEEEKNPNRKEERILFSLQKMKSALRIGQMEEEELERMEWKKCVGRISGEYAYLYPPGIPLLVPGEIVTEGLIDQISYYQRRQFRIQGLSDHSGDTLLVCSKGFKIKG